MNKQVDLSVDCPSCGTAFQMDPTTVRSLNGRISRAMRRNDTPSKGGGRPRKEYCKRGHKLADTRGADGRCVECLRVLSAEAYERKKKGSNDAKSNSKGRKTAEGPIQGILSPARI